MYRKCYRYDDLLPQVIASGEEANKVEISPLVKPAEEETIANSQVSSMPQNSNNHSSNMTGHQLQGRRTYNNSAPHRRYTPVGHIPNGGNRQPLNSPKAEDVKTSIPLTDTFNANNHYDEPSASIPSYESVPNEDSKEEPKSILSFFSGSTASSIKGIYDKLRNEVIKNGKVFGLLETDDLIIILLILILLSEDSEDYLLLLGLFALLFMK